jgi:hypothetical protein
MSETTVVTNGTPSRRRVYGGLYNDVTTAERGVRRFRDAGYPGERIGIVSRDSAAKEVAEDTGAKAASGAATGAVAGGVLGGLTGLLVGIGALAIPGIGPVVAGGMLASAFGLGGGTAVAGAGIGGGRTLVTVDDEDGRAEGLFDETGAERYRPTCALLHMFWSEPAGWRHPGITHACRSEPRDV